EERAAEDDAREDAARAKAVAEPSAGDFEERVGEREGGEGPRTEDGREVEAEFDVLADLDDADASDVGDGREAAQPGEHLPAHTRWLCSDGWFGGVDGRERHGFQGLKPLFIWVLSARLKPCPFKTCPQNITARASILSSLLLARRVLRSAAWAMVDALVRRRVRRCSSSPSSR